MRRKNQLIMGIGHRIKSLQNPDMRVCIIKVGAYWNWGAIWLFRLFSLPFFPYFFTFLIA